MKKPQVIKFMLLVAVLAMTTAARAQKIDSIFFHLYTDSLKKGTHNYINIDGKSSDGRWIPLTALQISFSTTGGRFENSDLVLPADFADEKVTVFAVLKEDTSIRKQRTIYVKTLPDPELKTKEEILGRPPVRQRGQRPSAVGNRTSAVSYRLSAISPDKTRSTSINFCSLTVT